MLRSPTFHTGKEHAIFCNNNAHALFHILTAYLCLFWCSIDLYSHQFHISYKRSTNTGPDHEVQVVKMLAKKDWLKKHSFLKIAVSTF